MAKVTKPLTNTEVKNAKPKAKEYSLGDGAGLLLRIKPSGSKLWIFNYTHPVTKKRKNLGLGEYPNLTLANARRTADVHRQILAQGLDPKTHKDQQQKKALADSQNTLFCIASEWFEKKQQTITEATAQDCWNSLKNHIFPSLGKIPIKEITAPMVIAELRPLEKSGRLDMTKRVCQRLNEIMTYAVNTGAIHANPTAGIREAFLKGTKKNNPHIDPKDLPVFMGLIARSSVQLTTRYLIEFQLHTMTRPAEASGAKWEEFDFGLNVWTIPAERMKTRKEHRIPLTGQVIQLLEELKPINGHRPFVFAGRDPSKPMSSETVNNALKKRLGLKDKMTAHGMRGLASTTLNDQGFEGDLVESALAHVQKDETRASYNHSDYLERRRPMMEWWSGHIEQASYGNLSITGNRTLRAV